MYFLASFPKIKNFPNVVKGFGKRFSKQLFEMPQIFYILSIVVAILIEFFCPLIIMYSVYDKKYKNYGYYACLTLILFTIKATYLYHFPPFGKEYYPFISNTTTIGGLSLLAYVLKYGLF
tara:strand:- start:1242 stop:1601 length:360 start_codon:yes stop_codon:yes gene_type:complete